MGFLVIEQEYLKLVFLRKLVKCFLSPALFHVLFRCLLYAVLSDISLFLVLIYFIDFAANWLFTTLGSCKVGLTVLVLLSVCFYFLFFKSA